MNIALKQRSFGGLPYKSNSMTFSEFSLLLLTLMLWSDRILLTYAKAVMLRLPLISLVSDFLVAAVYVLLIVFSIPQILKKMKLSDLVFTFVVILVCVLTFLIFPQNSQVLEENMPKFLFLTFPFYYIGLSLDFEKVYPWLYRISVLSIIAFTLYKLFISAPMDEIESTYEGDMWSSYNILPHVALVAIRMLKKPTITNVALTVVGTVIIALLGSRGPLLCLFVMMISYLLIFKKYKHPILAALLMITAAVVAILGLGAAMTYLNDLSKDLGLSVRIFEKYFDGVFSVSTSRDNIISKLLVIVGEHPIAGQGLFADRAAIDTYAHNIIIELWVSFGVFIGTALFVALAVIVIRALKKTKDFPKYNMIILPLLASGLIKLFISGSFLDEIYLFLLLGLCVALIRGRKSEEII